MRKDVPRGIIEEHRLVFLRAERMLASVILAEDHALVRQGLRRIIQEDPVVQVTHEAGDGLEVLEFLKDSQPDVILLDISMPQLGGLEAAQIIRTQYPAIKIVILTMHRERNFFLKALAIGVDGYILKDEADSVLMSAIHAVLKGRTYYSPLVSR